MSDSSSITVSSKYDIVVTRNGIEEKYSLDQLPPAKSQLVAAGKQEILQQLSLNQLVSGLKHSAGLMYVAYNALAGTDIQSEMQGLQTDLLTVTSKTSLTVQNFKSKTESLTLALADVYKWLIDGKEELAIVYLKQAGDCAASMAKESTVLSHQFEALRVKTVAISQKSIDEETREYKEKMKLEQALDTIKVQQAGVTKLQERLKEELEEVGKEYEEAKQKENRESDRAFGLGITRIVTDTIATGLGAYFAFKSPGMQLPAVQKAASQENETKSDSESLTEKLSKAQEQEKKVSQEITSKKPEIEQAKSELKNAEDTFQKAKGKDKKKKAQADVDTKKKALGDKQRELDQLDADLKEAQRKITAITNSVSKVAEGTKDLQNQAMTSYQIASQQKQELYKTKIALAKENREALSKLAEYAKLLENNTKYIENAKAAVETLHCAVQALSIVVVVLNNAALFWSQMGMFCERLASAKFTQDVMLYKQHLPEEARKELYKSDQNFKFTGIILLANWVAFHEVCKEYLDAVNEVYNQIGNNIKSSPTIENAKKAAPALAKKMLEAVMKDEAIADDLLKEMNKQLQPVNG